ncbi:uncharacterized protein LOC125833316 isoform X2 [Solanum verrucosum]|uniref:uncharacterized protein LOC125833316 isoform X2 n=1 Tax=Solanum verrucosum TaxID=315347 RepID=UPI0020D09876|nr:uncharacterized protein LOC125833316 isoform X2 [Solanum verrucosum]
MEQRSLERVVSQRALQIGSSFPCQICVLGFLSGVCLTSLFLASFGGLSLLSPISTFTSSSTTLISGDCNVKQKNIESRFFSHEKLALGVHERVSLLYSSWGNLVNQSANEGKSNLPKAPHLEDCKLSAETNERLDTRLQNDSFPPWTIWKGQLDNFPWTAEDEQLRYYRHQTVSEGAYPPWIKGSDEENYPLTRKVQRDIWLHQHPLNCSDGNVKFLIADWERIPGFGIGAQIAGMCGLLAIAINEKRVLVTSYYNRADHNGCKETSPECRDRAFELMKQKEAWEKGIITIKENYTSKEIWSGRTPRSWGKPWSYLQPTTDINGSLIAYHRKMDRRWWRAQAVRYLMRFQTEYTCNLLNQARHAAFGWEAARMVLESQFRDFPEGVDKAAKHDIESFVWSSHKPWSPRPMLSMHVRMGDKACEMIVVGFKEYMHLAERITKHFPNLKSIWLSTEMQEVVDQSRLYPHWTFYYTNVTRQTGNMTMATYEASLGRETSTNYPLVNFLLASEADFFIGALGSTWCFLIDGMRNTGGKVMSGYLSVNKDRFW